MLKTDIEFRNIAKFSPFPFTHYSTREVENYRVPEAWMLGAVLYPEGDIEVPYRIGEMYKGDNTGDVKAIIKDVNNLNVGEVNMSSTKDHAFVKDAYNAVIGVLVYHSGLTRSLNARLPYEPVFLSDNAFEFVAGVCFKGLPGDNEVIISGDNYFTGDVSVIAGNGIKFEEETDGSLSVNLYGENRINEQPIQNINGVSADDIWLAAAVWNDYEDCAVRVETGPDKLLIGRQSDF